MAAKNKTITTKLLSDIGLSGDLVGNKAAWSTVKDALPRPARTTGVKVEDGGNGGGELVDFLLEKRVI